MEKVDGQHKCAFRVCLTLLLNPRPLGRGTRRSFHLAQGPPAAAPLLHSPRSTPCRQYKPKEASAEERVLTGMPPSRSERAPLISKRNLPPRLVRHVGDLTHG